MNGASFNPRSVLALVLYGAVIFLALLWLIGRGDTGPDRNAAGSHGASNSLVGYAALAGMLERQGYDVSLSRNPQRLEAQGLLVITPPAFADPKEIAQAIERRRYQGPTLLILPKWSAMELPAQLAGGKQGWVHLSGAGVPAWGGRLNGTLDVAPRLDRLPRGDADWRGLGLSGRLPDRQHVTGLDSGPFVGLVRDSQGRALVAYADDRGCYPVLQAAAGVPGAADGDDCEERRWNLTIAFDPDLFNNYGMADRSRALLAARVIELAREGQDVPIVFDLTQSGYGANRNLLTLAFEPPFLAATLCLLLALLVAGWRAFARFGPPMAEAPPIAFGKARLAANSGGFLRRSGRLHLLAGPYADLVARRLAGALGLRQPDPAGIDAALARRAPDGPRFTDLAARLGEARGPSQTLRAAHALHALERTSS